MKKVILFFVTFLFILLIYEFTVVINAKKNEKNGNSNKRPMEIRYLIFKYKLDMDKINYNLLLHIVALVSSFDMAVVVSLVSLVKSFFLEIFLALILIIPIVLMSYHLVYIFYKKKGMVKNV